MKYFGGNLNNEVISLKKAEVIEEKAFSESRNAIKGIDLFSSLQRIDAFAFEKIKAQYVRIFALVPMRMSI